MVAVIKTGHSLSRILNYNENKVKEGVAECINAVGYPMDTEQLNFGNKLKMLQRQADLNENVSRNSVHISLNFDPAEKLSKEQLQEIADAYMQKIGFGEQPYLVYRHDDAGHPHIHIVSVKVRADGSRIDTHNIGRNQSEKARQEIEHMYGLKRAQDSKVQAHVYKLKPINAQRVQYGKSETKRAIQNVLDKVVNEYKYTSLPALNAVLKLYNVVADPCSEKSRIFSKHGLVYRVLDEAGNKVGVPIKASDFYNKPTLLFLQGKFGANETTRQPHKARIKNAIDQAILKQPGQSLEALMIALQKVGLDTLMRQNEQGIIYGITYVDHQTKCVFNGSELGKAYSAKGLLERCGEVMKNSGNTKVDVNDVTPQSAVVTRKDALTSVSESNEPTSSLEVLLQAEQTTGFVPNQLAKKGKKRKKKGLSTKH
jgi:hypothetical protein